MEAAEGSSKSEVEAMENEVPDGCSAGAFFSSDFEWETLRVEIEDSPRGECEIVCHSAGFRIGKSVRLDAGRQRWYLWGESLPRVFTQCMGGVSQKSFEGSLLQSITPRKILDGTMLDPIESPAFGEERRYLVKEFPELLSASGPSRILEIGCGTGSSVVPILRSNKNASVYGCDCSSVALERATELVTEQADLDERQIQKFRPFLCDISSDTLPSWLCCSFCRVPVTQHGEMKDEKQLTEFTRSEIRLGQACRLPIGERCLGGVDIVTLIFTLSAIAPANMHHVLAEIEAVLQPGGYLLFRDYGLYDMTMLRFPPSQKVSERLYRRKDGTLAYFFSLQVMRDLFTKVGLVEEELYYCCVQLKNRRTGRLMKRVWVHAKFRKLPI